MEVKMNKEIRDYQESMFMGLDLRQCVCSVLAVSYTHLDVYKRQGNDRWLIQVLSPSTAWTVPSNM